MRGGRLKERDALFELVLKWITKSEVHGLKLPRELLIIAGDLPPL
jgi:hypothetical protein